MRQRQRRSKHLSIISYPPGPGQRVTSDINIYILEYVRAGEIGRAVNMELDAGKKTEDGREEVRQDGKNAGDAPDLISVKELFPFVHYEYGEAYYGSRSGWRFRIAREPLKNVHFTPPDKRGEASLRAVVWPEPYSYAATEDTLKTVRDFPFTQEGMEQAADWLNSFISSTCCQRQP